MGNVINNRTLIPELIKVTVSINKLRMNRIGNRTNKKSYSTRPNSTKSLKLVLILEN